MNDGAHLLNLPIIILSLKNVHGKLLDVLVGNNIVLFTVILGSK